MSARADTERPIRTPHDAIVTLCELQAEVNRRMRHEHAADCFCGERDEWVRQGWWCNEGEAIRFIIEATRRAMGTTTDA